MVFCSDGQLPRLLLLQIYLPVPEIGNYMTVGCVRGGHPPSKHSLPVKMQAGVSEFPALSSSLRAQHVQWGYERLLTLPQAVHQAPAMRSKNRNDLISILLQRMQTWCKETALHLAF